MPQDDLLSYPSVALFVERASAVREIDRTEENLRAIGAICARLDGLPLAIELTAARSKLFSPGALLARLGMNMEGAGGLNLLGNGSGPRDLPERHQTLRNAIAWSYDLLNKSEQALFARLGVFTGGCTLSAVEAVCNARGDLGMDVLEGVTSLVDKSLLVQIEEERSTDDGERLDARFSMLEMIREYALDKLGEGDTSKAGEANEVSRYHAEYYLALAEAAEPELSGPKQIEWLRQLETEQDNLRAALGRSYKHGDWETILRLSGAIWRFWWVNKHVTEGRRWLEGTLSQAQALLHEHSPAIQPDVLAKALGAAGKLAWEQADYEQSASYLRESLALYRELGDERALASAVNSLGVPLVDLCEYVEAEALFEESLGLAERSQERAGIALALANLGNLASYQGNWEQAAGLHERSLEIRRQLDDKWHMIHSLRDLGRVTGLLAHRSHAVSLYEEAINLCRQVGDDTGLALSLKDLALLTVSEENYDQVLASCRESLAKCRELMARSGEAEVLYDIGRLAAWRGEYTQAEDALRNSLLLFRELDRKRESIRCLSGLGEVSAGQGNWEHALRLLVAVDILAENLTSPLLPRDRMSHNRSRADAQAHLDQQTAEAARTEGAALTEGGRQLKQVIAYALEEPPGT